MYLLFIGNVQEKALKKYGATNAELVLYSYGIGFVILFIGHSIYGDIFQLFIFLIKVSLFELINSFICRVIILCLFFWTLS